MAGIPQQREPVTAGPEIKKNIRIIKYIITKLKATRVRLGKKASTAITPEKLPPLPLALVSCNGEALTKEQTLLEYCVNRSISQSSRLKFNWKLFVINEEYLKGVHDFFKL